MLADLTDSQVKNAAGAEVKFRKLLNGDRRSEFVKVGASPAFPVKLTISHQESGEGITKRRRSVLRFDESRAGQVDTTTKRSSSAYVVLDSQIGNATDLTLDTDLLAYLTAMLSKINGSGTTILYDGSPTGSAALLNGDI